MKFDQGNAFSQLSILTVNAGAHDSVHGWSSASGAHFDVINPATEKSLASVISATEQDMQKVIDTAVSAQLRWRGVPAPRRGELVNRIGELCKQHQQALAAVISLETGKSLAESLGEVREVIDMATLAAGQSRMLYGATQQSQRTNHRMYDQWLPLGVVGIISAYNFPAAVWAQNGFLAAIGGNTVIWKPSPKVSLSAIALQKLCITAMTELGQEGVFSLVIPEGNEVAEQLVIDPRVSLISFTGSSGVGRKVANIVGRHLGRRALLECSGNNGCIVDETADLKLAAAAITFGAVGTSGQRCTSTRRVIAHRSIAAPLVELLKKAYGRVVVGDPVEDGILVGPLVDQAAADHFERSVAQAIELGGKVAFGGKRMDRPGYFVEPTIIVDARNEWPCVQEETFAPLIYVMEYENLEDAINLHNGVAQGLASGIHSTHVGNIELFLSAAGSDCGIAKVNMGTTGADVGAAFGGEKETGGGRTAGSDAWKGYMRRQSVCINWGHETPWLHLVDD